METREPAFDSPAKWITPDLQAQAIAAGYAVVDHTSVLAAHLSELIKQNAHDLLTRQETKRLIDRLSDSHPKLVDELISKADDARRSAKSSPATAARTGFDPRSGHDS